MRTLTVTTISLLLAACCAARADTAADFLQRNATVDRDDPAELMGLARWAEQRNLAWQAASVYVRVLQLEPDHSDAYRNLSHIGDTNRLPDEPEREKKLLEAMSKWGEGFRVFSNQHFIILYNTDEKFARNRGVLLEKTHHLFFDAFRKADLRPIPLGGRLVCVLFDQRDDFKRFASEVDKNDADWSTGYFSAANNHIAFYNDQSNPQFAEYRKRIAELDREVDRLNERLREAEVRRTPALKLQVGADRKNAVDEKRKLENLIDNIAMLSNAAKTTHEATHQLAFNTGIQLVTVHYPFWIAEGLATNFEAADPAANFGPFQGNPDRSGRLAEAFAKRQLMPLDDFVALTGDKLGKNEQQIKVYYAQAWGLFNFLFKQRHQQMRDYLRNLAALPAGTRSPEQMRKSFIDAFGPLDRLDDEWTAWLRRL